MKLKIPTRDLHRLYFTADQHFGANDKQHKLTDEFDTSEERDNALIARWNQVIPKDSLVIHAGDLAFRRTGHYLDQLNFGRLVLVQGNHDEYRLNRVVRERFWKICDLLDLTIIFEKGDTHPMTVCHYPMQTWNKSTYKAWHVHGHSHGKLRVTKPYTLDLCAFIHGGRPLRFDEVLLRVADARQANKRQDFLPKQPQGRPHDKEEGGQEEACRHA